jgi:hypothetical protein
MKPVTASRRDMVDIISSIPPAEPQPWPDHLPSPEVVEAAIVRAGYTIKGDSPITWYALLPGETEFRQVEREDGHADMNYLGFFSSKRDLLVELGESLFPDGGEAEGDVSIEAQNTGLVESGVAKLNAALDAYRAGTLPVGFEIDRLESGCLLDSGIRSQHELDWGVLEILGLTDDVNAEEEAAIEEDYEFLHEITDDALDAATERLPMGWSVYRGEDASIMLEGPNPNILFNADGSVQHRSFPGSTPSTRA